MPAVIGYKVSSVASMRACVQTAAVALLLTYTVNFVCQFYVVVIKQWEQQSEKTIALHKLLETSRVLYWFAVAVMFSVYPPFYFGIHSAVFAVGTLIAVVLMHVFCVVDPKVCDRSVWAHVYYYYYCLICAWIFVALTMGFIWSQYQTPPSYQY